MSSERIRYCQCCGKELIVGKHKHNQRYCNNECKNEMRRYRYNSEKSYKERLRRERMKTAQTESITNSEALNKLSTAALNEGLSYGFYVAKYGL